MDFLSRDQQRRAVEELAAPSGDAQVRVALRAVESARQPHHEDRRRLGLDGEVGQHIDHQRLLAEQLAKRAAVRRVMGRLRDGVAHEGRGPDHAVEARVVDHLDDRPYSPPLFPHHDRPRVVELDLRRRVGAVAQLVLEALDVKGVAFSIGQDARKQEA